MLRQILAEQAPGDVIRAASREADDEVDRLAWIIERRCAHARERENGKATRELLVPAAIRRAAAIIRLKFRARKLGGGDLLTHASRGTRLLSQPHAEEGALAPVSKHGPQGRPLPSFE